ncbi:MAG: DedA family protein [Cyanobacteriota bacterium]|jgi:membrane protein DedA with SNARE-associated domain
MAVHALAWINLEGVLDQALLQDLIQRWGYGVIFVAMLLENAGVPLPGETVTLLGGYAAGSGQLNVWGVMAAAASGAILGDNVGYWVGRRAGWGLILRVGRLLRQSPEQLERLREQFLRHANASVLLGRFVAVLRVVAGPMAGAVGMPYRRFVLCNGAGAVLWAGSMVSLAWLGGRWIPFSQMVGGVVDFGLGALALVTVIVLLPKVFSALERRQLTREAPPARSTDPSLSTADEPPPLAPRPTGP